MTEAVTSASKISTFQSSHTHMLVILDDRETPTKYRIRATTTASGHQADVVRTQYWWHSGKLCVRPEDSIAGTQLCGHVKRSFRTLTRSKSGDRSHPYPMWEQVKDRAEEFYRSLSPDERRDIGQVILIDKASLKDRSLAGRLDPLALEDRKGFFRLTSLDKATHEKLWSTLWDVASAKGEQPSMDPPPLDPNLYCIIHNRVVRLVD